MLRSSSLNLFIYGYYHIKQNYIVNNGINIICKEFYMFFYTKVNIIIQSWLDSQTYEEFESKL